MTNIIIQAFLVLDEIKKDPKYLLMKQLDLQIGKLYPNEIKAFQDSKKVYDEVMATGGSYHPDFKNVVQKFSKAKSVLYGKNEVSLYFQTEKELQEEINSFLKEMTDSISSFIKTPDKLGIVQKGGSCHVR